MTHSRADFTGNGKPATDKYRPTVRAAHWYRRDHRPFHAGDVVVMLRDYRIQLGLRTLLAPLTQVKMEATSPDPAVQAFVQQTLTRVWSKHLPTLARSMQYGHAGGEPVYAADPSDLMQFVELREVHPLDMVPLEHDGKFWGVKVKNLSEWLPCPRALWVTHEPEFSRYYGTSRLYGAWESHQEKHGKRGMLEMRRKWYLKLAMAGRILRHPPGDTLGADGAVRSNQSYAMELLEILDGGGDIAMPGAMDPETKEFLWKLEQAEIKGGGVDIRDAVKDLDIEMTEGMGIHSEVIQAAETGSGWAGRTVPFLVFLASLDSIAAGWIAAVVEQIIRPLVEYNFGPGARFVVVVKSLVPKDVQGQAMQQPGGEGDPDAQPDADGRSPYVGKRGGKGWRDAQGNVHYGEMPGAQLSINHAPAGGVTIQGKFYHGGEFIPGEVLEKATAEERAQLEGKGGEKESAPEKEPWEMTADEFRAALDVRKNEPVALSPPVSIPFEQIHARPADLARAKDRAERFIKDYEEGAKFPPIKVIPDGRGGYEVDDGLHRYTAISTKPPAELKVIIKYSPEVSFDLRNPKRADALRKHFVTKALAAGKAVPPEVLADYPDLDENSAKLSFDESQHQRGQPANAGQFGPGGGGAPADTEPEKPDHSSLSGKLAAFVKLLARIPAQVKQQAIAFVSRKYQSLVEKYGPKGAKAILLGMIVLTPVPLPGTSLVPIAIAEGIRRLKGGQKQEGAQMSTEGEPPDLAAELAQALAEWYAEIQHDAPAFTPEQLQAALAAATEDADRLSLGAVEPDGHAELVRKVRDRARQVPAPVKPEAKPETVTKAVERDPEGNIVRITETRG